MALIALFARVTRSTNRSTPRHGDHRMPATERYLTVYAERLVQSGKAPDISAVVNDAHSDKVGRDGLDRLRETAALADPAKVGRMLAHIDAQAAALPDR
jgi:hypothetical protein